MQDEPVIAFAVDPDGERPGIELRVNFGVYAGREATPAEIDRLAEWLLDDVGAVSIVAEERHEIDAHGEAAIHLVRIEVPPDAVTGDARRLEQRLLERAQHWARVCATERRATLTDGA